MNGILRSTATPRAAGIGEGSAPHRDRPAEPSDHVIVRRAGQRGHFDHGWLNTWHTFSFADYYDPRHMGFRALRVINEDWVQSGAGFGMHGHKDMEIITYVLEGSLEHRDSMGHGSVLRAGDLQHMSAGTGIRHSEFNPSPTDTVHLYQIWLLPEVPGLSPSYAELRLADRPVPRGLRLVGSRDGRSGSLKVHQDVDVYLASPARGEAIQHPLRAGRHAWLQVLRGEVEFAGHTLVAGDGASLSQADGLSMRAASQAEVMVFDLA